MKLHWDVWSFADSGLDKYAGNKRFRIQHVPDAGSAIGQDRTGQDRVASQSC
jgi:hypothetical protein